MLHSRQRRTEPRPQVACTENLVKFRHVVFEILKRTDRHTDTKIAILRTPPGDKVITELGQRKNR